MKIYFNHSASVVMVVLSLLPARPCHSHGSLIEEVMVVGERAKSLRDVNQGTITAESLDQLPQLRVGNVLEAVPGMMATQHSGSGKANQYYLRGFNLDHGTDFSSSIDFMPINMRSHGHGQGYTDLNFIIPELLQSIDYRKGPYFADTGDFSGTGSVHMFSANLVPNFLSLEAGQLGYRRAALAYSTDVQLAQLLAGVEYQSYAGDWQNVSEDVDKKNVWIKYATGTPSQGSDVSLMLYENSWNAADQIPDRAVRSGQISPYSTIDPSDGGDSHRYSISAQQRWVKGDSQFLVSGYLIDYGLNLWSNFTYFTKPGGDQFLQVDERKIYGLDAMWTVADTLFDRSTANTFGLKWQFDDINKLGLFNTQERQVIDVVRKDAVQESSLAAYWQSAWQLSNRLRSLTGVRYERFHFGLTALDAAVASSLTPNSGSEQAGIWTGGQKLTYTFSPAIDAYASIGRGFHSNDARGVLMRVEPTSGQETQSANPLVPLLGYEAGVNLGAQDDYLQVSAAAWALNIDSELIYVGDAGNTEDTAVGSARHGIELSSVLQLSPQLRWELEYSNSHAALNEEINGRRTIAGSLRHTLVNELVFTPNDTWLASIRARHFSSYPLDDGAWARASQLVNARLQYAATRWLLRLDVLNMLNSDDHDIEYFYPSQLLGESMPYDDHHYHVFEPRSVRMTWRYTQ
jgi:hypothetical protein